MLSIIERKVLGALILLSDVNGYVKNTTTTQIAKSMGYKQAGGVISMALKSLEQNNRISVARREEGRASMNVQVYL